MTSTYAISSAESAASIYSRSPDRRTLPTRSHPHHCGIMAFGGPSRMRGLTRRRMQHTPHLYFNMPGGLPNIPSDDAQPTMDPAGSLAKMKEGKGPASVRVSVHEAVIWPRTGVKVQPEPFATIDRARLMSTVSLVVVADRISNGVTAFTSPEGTLNTTVRPSSILPVAATTTSTISLYLPSLT